MPKRMGNLQKLKGGDKVGVVSPSFAAPGKWPEVYKLGLARLRDTFHLNPVEFPMTKKIGSSKEDRAKDLIAAFENPEIKAVISTIGGNDQVTYIKNLPTKPFTKNPKPFLGFSDNTHFANFLWLHGIPSYYGGAIFSQFAEQGGMHPFTFRYLRYALFEKGEFGLEQSNEFNDEALDWSDPSTLNMKRKYEFNAGWFWSGSMDAEGLSWGGCVESIDEILRCDVPMPTLTDFETVVLILETSEEIPSAEYIFRVVRVLGERGILKRIKGILIGRPQAWYFDKKYTATQKEEYKKLQRETIESAVRAYNATIPIIQNIDFGHTNPQIPLPYGRKIRIDSKEKKYPLSFKFQFR